MEEGLFQPINSNCFNPRRYLEKRRRNLRTFPQPQCQEVTHSDVGHLSDHYQTKLTIPMGDFDFILTFGCSKQALTEETAHWQKTMKDRVTKAEQTLINLIDLQLWTSQDELQITDVDYLHKLYAKLATLRNELASLLSEKETEAPLEYLVRCREIARYSPNALPESVKQPPWIEEIQATYPDFYFSCLFSQDKPMKPFTYCLERMINHDLTEMPYSLREYHTSQSSNQNRINASFKKQDVKVDFSIHCPPIITEAIKAEYHSKSWEAALIKCLTPANYFKLAKSIQKAATIDPEGSQAHSDQPLITEESLQKLGDLADRKAKFLLSQSHHISLKQANLKLKKDSQVTWAQRKDESEFQVHLSRALDDFLFEVLLVFSIPISEGENMEVADG